MQTETKYYRIYAKFKGEKNFKPIDCNTGRPVINLFYATFFPEETLPKLIVNYKNIDSRFALIEARSCEGNIIKKINY